MAKALAKPAAAIVLAAPNTDAGALERLFILEAANPSNLDYAASDNLPAMRLMRQTIENRLKSPQEYNAKGASSAIEIIELGNQFAGFGDYPELDATMSGNLIAILAVANNPRHPQQTEYAKFVQDAITAATESVNPSVANYTDVTAWRTVGGSAPGGRFRVVETIAGNTFYATTPVPPMPPRHAKHPRRRR